MLKSTELCVSADVLSLMRTDCEQNGCKIIKVIPTGKYLKVTLQKSKI